MTRIGRTVCRWIGAAAMVGLPVSGGAQSAPPAIRKPAQAAAAPARGQSQARTAAGGLQRTPDGQPDIEGYWSGGGLTIEPGYDGNLGTGFYQDFFPDGATIGGAPSMPSPAPGSGVAAAQAAGPRRGLHAVTPDGRIPFQPWARSQKEANFKKIYDPKGAEKFEEVDTVARCQPTGVPRASYIGIGSYQVFQPKGYVVVFGEWNHQYRIIPLDNRPHVGKNISLWMGDSRGRWEGNTLVVDVQNSRGDTWLDHMGSIHTEGLRVTERFEVVDGHTIRYSATLDDPKAFTRPWDVALTWTRVTEKGFELLEYACHEGNTSLENYTAIGK